MYLVSSVLTKPLKEMHAYDEVLNSAQATSARNYSLLHASAPKTSSYDISARSMLVPLSTSEVGRTENLILALTRSSSNRIIEREEFQ